MAGLPTPREHNCRSANTANKRCDQSCPRARCGLQKCKRRTPGMTPKPLTGRPCTICRHPDRAQIEAGAALPLRTLAPRHGVTVAALFRHRRNHVSGNGSLATPATKGKNRTKPYIAETSPAVPVPEPRRLVSWWGRDNAPRQGERCCQCGGRAWLQAFDGGGGCFRCWVPKLPWARRFET